MLSARCNNKKIVLSEKSEGFGFLSEPFGFLSEALGFFSEAPKIFGRCGCKIQTSVSTPPPSPL